MEKERSVYLNSKEQLLIASKVNRLCDIDIPEGITPAILEDAKEIVAALDTRIKPSGISFSGSYKSSRRSKGVLSATDVGTTKTDFQTSENKDFIFGKIDSYRIGMYIAEKGVDSGKTYLDFVHFWDYKKASSSKVLTYINYNPKDLSLKAIGKLIPNPKKFGRFILIKKKDTVLWGKSDRGDDWGLIIEF